MSKRLRFFILLSVFVLGALVLYPTYEWYFMLSDEVKTTATGTREEIRSIASERAEVDTNRFVEMLNGTTTDIYIESLPKTEEGLKRINDEAKDRLKLEEKTLKSNASAKEIAEAYKNRNEVYYTLLDHYRQKILDIKNRKERIITLGLDLSGGLSAILQVDLVDLEERLGHSPSEIERADAINRAMFVLQSRIDKFGVSEPRIRQLGNNSILIEVPGDNDRERVNSFIQNKGSIAFLIVNQEATDALIDLQNTTPTWEYEESNIPSFIPAGTEIKEYVVRDEFGIDQHQRWIAVYQDVNSYGVDGAHLTQAQVTNDPLNNRPLVNFQLDNEGAQKLAKITSDYINESMAIVLDDKVRAYATLSSVINNGQAVIRGFDQDLAQDISTILQTASLPVTLEVVNQQVIGPSLGQIVIREGLRALVLGFLLVVVFTLFYYKGAGVIAIISLFCNVYLLTALLSAFNFTLTLTGIAGIILTVGMAVDANVLIFERIKEELAAGKSRRTAIQTGFQRAFLTIVDANLTTFIAAFFISQIASGPIQGFAVTLSIGIMTTLFTALFVSRLLFDFATDIIKRERISISWGKLHV